MLLRFSLVEISGIGIGCIAMLSQHTFEWLKDGPAKALSSPYYSQNALYLLRSMERTPPCEPPKSITGPESFKHLAIWSIAHLYPRQFGFNMPLVTPIPDGHEFHSFTLTVIYIIPPKVFALTMTNLTVRSIANGLWSCVDRWISCLPPFGRAYMTIGATLPRWAWISSQVEESVIRMLCFQYTGFAQCVCIIGKVGLYVIVGFLYLLPKILYPRKVRYLPSPPEIIFHVALCAYQRTHFLRSRFIDIFFPWRANASRAKPDG